MLLCAAMDHIAASAVHLRHVMGLPQREPSAGMEDAGTVTAAEADPQPHPPSQPASPG